MKLRKAIPIIGTISSGKSFFLDSLLGLNLLESQSSTTTKFVCIIQHHKELKEPKFYQIDLIQQNINPNNNFWEYEGKAKGKTIKGYDKIRKKIKEINKEQKNIPSEKIKYEELFYVLEIKINTINDEELLNNYDFYDIPGLDEYIPDKNNENKVDNVTKMKYIDKLFKYFKSRIDFGIIVINAESYYAKSSKEVIVNISNILKPQKIKNYLIILNKIDKQSEPNNAIIKTKRILVNNLLDELNLADNYFISLDSRQLKHQTLLKDNFENYLLFLFNSYVTKYIIPFKDNKKINDNEEGNINKYYSFSKYLYVFMTEDINESEKNDYILQLGCKFDKKYKFKKLKFDKLIENIKDIEYFRSAFDIDLNDEESVILFKSLYFCFKEEIKYPYYDNAYEVFEYFNNILDIIKNEKNAIIKNESLDNLIDYKFFDEFNDIIQNFNNEKNSPCIKCGKTKKEKEKYKEEKNKNIKNGKKFDFLSSLLFKFNCHYCEDFKVYNNLNDLNNIFDSLFNNIIFQQIFYIGIFGNSSTGKSLIFNNIFGINILPVSQNETTKRGIVIEDGQNIALFKAKLEILKYRERNYSIFKKLEKVVTGEKKVKEILELINYQYAKETDKKDYNFFILTLPIKYFDDINLDINLRKKIKFIDLPGYNTKNAEQNFFYEPIIESISCFLINFKISSIGGTDNLFNTNIYQNIKNKNNMAKKSSLNCDYLKCCLHIINLWDNENIVNNDKINDWKNNINKVIQNSIENNNEINITYVNANLYQTFLSYEKLFFNYQYLFNTIISEYKRKNSKKLLIEFFSQTLKKYLKEKFNLKEKDIKDILSKQINQEIYTKVNNLFENNRKYDNNIFSNKEKYNKNINEICSYLTYANQNIKSIYHYKNSYIEKFFNDLKDQIIQINNLKTQNCNILFDNFINKFKDLFGIDEKNLILHYKKYLDSFLDILQNSKYFNMPYNILSYRNKLKKLEEYYKIIKKVGTFGSGKSKGNEYDDDTRNGICNEQEEPKIYRKFFERQCEGEFLKRSVLKLDEKFDDIIVGWQIESCWRDGTNGEWELKYNPLLCKKIECEFISKRFRGQRFNIHVFLIKDPS